MDSDSVKFDRSLAKFHFLNDRFWGHRLGALERSEDFKVVESCKIIFPRLQINNFVVNRMEFSN